MHRVTSWYKTFENVQYYIKNLYFSSRENKTEVRHNDKIQFQSKNLFLAFYNLDFNQHGTQDIVENARNPSKVHLQNLIWRKVEKVNTQMVITSCGTQENTYFTEGTLPVSPKAINEEKKIWYFLKYIKMKNKSLHIWPTDFP